MQCRGLPKLSRRTCACSSLLLPGVGDADLTIGKAMVEPLRLACWGSQEDVYPDVKHRSLSSVGEWHPKRAGFCEPHCMGRPIVRIDLGWEVISDNRYFWTTSISFIDY